MKLIIWIYKGILAPYSCRDHLVHEERVLCVSVCVKRGSGKQLRKLVFTLIKAWKNRKSSVFSNDKNRYLSSIYYSPIIIDEFRVYYLLVFFQTPKVGTIITIPSIQLSQVVLVVKNPPANARDVKRCRFDPLVGNIPWRRAWQPILVFLPGESHGQRSLMDYSS